jgi:hypothetical protein
MLAKDPANRPTAQDISVTMAALSAVAGPLPTFQYQQPALPAPQGPVSPVSPQGWQAPPASPVPGGYPQQSPGMPVPQQGYPQSPGTPLPPGYPQGAQLQPYQPRYPAPAPSPLPPGVPSPTPLPSGTPLPAPSPSGFFYPQAEMFTPEGAGGDSGPGSVGAFTPSPPPFTEDMFAPHKPQRGSKRTLWIVGAVVLVLALAGGGFALLSGSGSNKPQASGTATATALASTAGCPAQTGPTASARWTLAGTAADCAASSNALTLANGAAFANQSPRGPVLRFTGGYANATVPTSGVVNTSSGFTVSVWVYLDSYNKAQYATVLSFFGRNQAAFELQYNPGWHGWAFNRSSGDSLGASWVAAAGGGYPQDATWTHLVGVYDASGKTLTLYVDGKAVSTRTGISAWQAGGKLSIGANINAGGAASEGMTGDVSNLELFDSALSAQQIAGLQ